MSTPGLPEPITFFVDRCLGKGVVAALREAGASVQAHADHFAHDAPDVAWLPAVGARGWVVLTKDKRIRFRRIERDAMLAAKLRVFVLAGKTNLIGSEMSQIFVSNLRAMYSLARKEQAPFIAGVSRSGVRLYDLSKIQQSGNE